jgi:Tfp pilus assembly protein PilX
MIIMNTRFRKNMHLHSRQRGVILVIALIVLVAMTLVAIGTLRSVDTGNVVAGNLGFKQATLNGTDRAVETAYRYLAVNLSGVVLQNDAKPGYASSVPAAEPDWTNAADTVWTDALCMNGCAADANGNKLYYVIHSMCSEANTPYNGTGPGGPNQCHKTLPTGGTAGDSKSVGFVSPGTGNPQLYYRITAKVVGPRNSVSIVQAVVAI